MLRALVALAILTASAPAAAEDRWYGWQTGIADLSASLIVGEAVTDPRKALGSTWPPRP